jgi:DNA primase
LDTTKIEGVLRPNKDLIKLWSTAAATYNAYLFDSPAADYLKKRGLYEWADQFMLGYVSKPSPGHDEKFVGMLSIPYITRAGVIGFKFRHLTDDKTPRYLAPLGQRLHLYNVNAIAGATDEILIVEGELDAIAATIIGHPAVAVAGVSAWKPWFSRCFDGISKIIIVTDNDDKEDGSNPGQDLAKRLIEQLPNAIRVSLPLGHDVNSSVMSYGAQHFTSLVNAI